QRAMARLFAGAVDRDESQGDELDAVGFPVIAAELFAADFDRAVQIRRHSRMVLAHRLAGRRRVLAGDLAVSRLGAGEHDTLDVFRARDFQYVDGAVDADFHAETRISLRA